MAKVCEIEGCNRGVWKANKCLLHTPKLPIKKSNKPLKKGNNKLKKTWLSKEPSEKQKAKKALKTENTKKLHEWFQQLWRNEPHYSEISGKWLGYLNNTCFWHHLYPKSKFPEYALDRDNIIRLTADEHAECEANPKKYDIVVKRLEFLKNKYGK